MLENAVSDIPRFHTALAEWLSCNLFVILLGTKIKMKNYIIFSAIYLVALAFFLEITATIPLLLWIMCMLLAFLSIVGFIWLCNRISLYESVFYAVMAFSVAECIASLEWQVVNYIYADTSKMPLIIEVLAIFIIYGSVIIGIWKLLKTRISKEKLLRIEKKDWLISLFICVLVFGFSNISFLSFNSITPKPYSIQIGAIRTVVDIAGVSMLYAHLLSCCNSMVRRELDAVQSALKNQYIQYKQSRESIDIINMKYHDMKHQINILRETNDSEQRAAFLDRMEADIKAYELQNKTGNSVLDTLLTSKSMQCDKHGISMTVVADGTLLDFMDAMDICSIFGNAIDNAIEATMKLEDREKRLIHVNVSQVKSFVMIRFENYFKGNLKKEGGNFMTTKKNAENHGYCIKSINYTVEKYDGVVDIKVNDKWFEIKILIPTKEK